MAKVTRKAIVSAMMDDEVILAQLINHLGTDGETIMTTLVKWNDALSKASKTTKTNKNDDIIINDIVPFIVNADAPVTAKTINDQFIHAERTNKASAMLRRAIELGLISRDRVRKNANYVYAKPDFDWEEYIAAYDAKVAEKAAARIAKARANRS